jgi:DnaJ homolog subfamily C member 17
MKAEGCVRSQKRMEQELEEQKTKQKQAGLELEPPAFGMLSMTFGNKSILEPTDTTVRIKYTPRTGLTAFASLFARFGETEILVVSLKPLKKASQKPPKYGTALIPFTKISDAISTVRDERMYQG